MAPEALLPRSVLGSREQGAFEFSADFVVQSFSHVRLFATPWTAAP